MLLFDGRGVCDDVDCVALGHGGPLCDEANSEGDEDNAGPALGGDLFVQPELREQGDDHVSERCGGEHEGEVGPGEGGEIAGEKADQQRDAEGDPGCEDRGDEGAGVSEGDCGHMGHAAAEAGVAERGAHCDEPQDHPLIRR